jgi:phytoene synthase
MPHRSTANLHSSVADRVACRSTLRGGSKTFFAASLALPKSVREPATALYAFCRMADDAIDLGVDRSAALEDLHRRLERAYAGTPIDDAADRAFADCVLRFSIPKQFPLALLEGFEWDSTGRRYQTLSQLKAYGVRVAGTVGTMMAMVMNVREPRLLARACDLGVAMQLTNIARDVGEDARYGRLYLPLDWLRDAGVNPEAWMARPVFTREVAAVVERLLKEADTLYARSEAGLASLPATCRPGMYAARLLYAEIGKEVARRGFDSVSQRAVVPWRRKARILADALIVALQRAAATATGGFLEEGEFLLAAVPVTVPVTVQVTAPATAPVLPAPAESARERARWPQVEDRVAWLVNLFERLERRDAAAAEAANP